MVLTPSLWRSDVGSGYCRTPLPPRLPPPGPPWRKPPFGLRICSGTFCHCSGVSTFCASPSACCALVRAS